MLRCGNTDLYGELGVISVKLVGEFLRCSIAFPAWLHKRNLLSPINFGCIDPRGAFKKCRLER